MQHQSSSSSLLAPESAAPGAFSNMLSKFVDIAHKGKSIAEKGKNIAQKGLTASLDTFHSTAQSVGLKDKVRIRFRNILLLFTMTTYFELSDNGFF
jgi:hypothetical protein